MHLCLCKCSNHQPWATHGQHILFGSHFEVFMTNTPAHLAINVYPTKHFDITKTIIWILDLRNRIIIFLQLYIDCIILKNIILPSDSPFLWMLYCILRIWIRFHVQRYDGPCKRLAHFFQPKTGNAHYCPCTGASSMCTWCFWMFLVVSHQHCGLQCWTGRVESVLLDLKYRITHFS